MMEWVLSLSLGNYLGGRVAGLYESFALPTLFAWWAGSLSSRGWFWRWL
jgi:hypothetical protein